MKFKKKNNINIIKKISNDNSIYNFQQNPSEIQNIK